MVPISGSAYTYAYATLGELVAWIIGWDLIIEYAVGNVAVAITWGNYFKTFVAGLRHRHPRLALDRLPHGAPHIPGLLDQRAAPVRHPDRLQPPRRSASSRLITVVLVVGIRESAWFNAAMVVIKLVVLALLRRRRLGLRPRRRTGSPFAPNGWAGIQAGAAIVFFAYIGFDAVSTVAEEMPQPATRHAHRHHRLARRSARSSTSSSPRC